MKKLLLVIILSLNYYSCWLDIPIPHTVEISLPFRYQEDPNWCGVACVQMWALKDGLDFSQHYIASQICGKNGKSSMEDVATGVQMFTHSPGFCATFEPVDEGQDEALANAAGSLTRNNPAIIPFYGGTHAIIARKFHYTETLLSGVIIVQNVTFHDPGYRFGEDSYLNAGYLKSYYFTIIVDELYPLGAYKVVVDDCNYSFSAKKGYKEFLHRNGTYSGGTESYIPAGSEFVRVSYPIGSEELHLEDIEHIKWESNGLSGNIKLELLKNDVYLGTIATNLPIQQGDYRWKVGEYQDDWATIDDDYKIKITMMDGSDYDTSNVDFSIIEPLITYTITATAGAGGTINPSGSVNVIQGANKTFNITPNSCYIIQDVTVDGLSRGAIPSYTFTNVQANHSIAAVFAPAATYTITATAGSGGTITPSGNIIVCQGENRTFQMISNSGYAVQSVTVDGVAQGAITSYTFSNVQTNHTIAATFAQIGVTILTPNGGENWEYNTYKNITWNAPGITGNVQLSLYRNGKAIGWIANWAAYKGTYDWKVGTNDENTPMPVPAGNGYSIKINSWDGTYVDTSNAPFNIYRSSGSLTVTSPNGGESWKRYSVQKITWTAPGVTGNVFITLYRNGSKVGWIANWAAYKGSLSWTVGVNAEGGDMPVPVGSGYTIEIKSMNGSFIDESNGPFSIY